MTSLLQPMDQGIIYNMKQHYRKRILTNILTQVDEGNSVMAIDLLQAVRNLSNIWNVCVKPETIANCFKKAGFPKDAIQIPFEHWDEEDLLSKSDLAALQSSFKKVANIEASFDDYVNVDNGVQTWDNPSEEDILNSIFESRGVPAEPDNDEHDLTVEELAETEEALPTLIQAASFFSVIRTFVEIRSDVPINVFNSLHDLEAFIENEKWKTVIQTKLTDYFK
ncbi:tigger transposable element-derived protein 6-like [Anastrepha ludens]|uniref:tigger transposable element-derived protein 6-like n=1 Tax=Anastrepha ludens TaxID=28586 RepID=UPI0023AFA6A4|nr:tigger transposable element-derived protein 6-like [Anastrepha ludens]